MHIFICLFVFFVSSCRNMCFTICCKLSQLIWIQLNQHINTFALPKCLDICAHPYESGGNICILWNWISTLGKNRDTRWKWIFLWWSKVVKHLSPKREFQPSRPYNHQYFHQLHPHLPQIHLEKLVWRWNMQQNINLPPQSRSCQWWWIREELVVTRSLRDVCWLLARQRYLNAIKANHPNFILRKNPVLSYWVLFCTQFDTLMSVWSLGAFNQISF